MPPPPSAEATAIEGAYGDQVKLLYKVLVSNLIDGAATGDSEQKSVDRFLAGLKMSRRGRDLALNALGSVVPSMELNSVRVEHGIVHANAAAG
jgi:hypothetical protein